MRVRDAVAGSMAFVSLGGLLLVTLGLVQWGIRAVAFFALTGLLWVFLLIALLGADVYAHRADR